MSDEVKYGWAGGDGRLVLALGTCGCNQRDVRQAGKDREGDETR